MIGGSSQRRKEGKRGKENVKIEGKENKRGLRENMKGQGKKEHGEEGEIRYEKGRRKEEGSGQTKVEVERRKVGKEEEDGRLQRIKEKDGGRTMGKIMKEGMMGKDRKEEGEKGDVKTETKGKRN